MTHTLGLWEIGEVVRSGYSPNDEIVIVLGDSGQITIETENAVDDAHLIAAAPELLEVLKAYVAWEVEYMTINNLGNPENQHNVKWARKVIAKAEPTEEREEA